MNVVLEILKYILPALIVFFTAFFSIRLMIRNDQKKREQELILKNKTVVTPVRLQAYERLVLLLERISPDALIMRFNKDNLTSKQLQNEMLKTIRSEFDHNVAQQIYISSRAWEVIKSARENTVKLINTTAQGIKPDAPSIHLSKALLEKMMAQTQTSNRAAIEYLKREIRQYF